MQQDNKNIDELFRSKLHDFEADVPSFVWDNISDNLQQKRRKKVIFYVRSLAASVVILLAFGAGYFFTQHNNHLSGVAVITDSTAVAKEIAVPMPADMAVAKEKVLPQPETAMAMADKGADNDNKVYENEENNKTKKADTRTSEQTEPKSDKKTNDKALTPTDNDELLRNNEFVAERNNKAELVELMEAFEPEYYAEYTESNEEYVIIMQQSNNGTTQSSNQIVRLTTRTMVVSKQTTNTKPNADVIAKHLLAQSRPQKKMMPIDIEPANTNSTQNTKSTWTVGGQFAPIMAHTESNNGAMYSGAANTKLEYLGSVVADDRTNYAATGLNNSPIPTQSYTGGLDLQYNSGKRWKLQTGLFFAKQGMAIDNLVINSAIYNSTNEFYAQTSLNEIAFDGQQNTQMDELRQSGEFKSVVMGGYNNAYYQSDFQMQQTLNYIEIPLMVKYALIDRRVGVNIMGGLNTGVLINNSLQVSNDSEKLWSGQNSQANAMNYSSTLGVGVEYRISRNISINIEPLLRSLLNSKATNEAEIKTSFACYSGIRFRLK